MNQEIKKDVLAILNRVIEILEEKEIRDVIELKDLSDRTIHNASIFQDHDSVSIGVLVYALAKIFERNFQNVKMYDQVFAKIVEAKDSLKKDDIDNYRLCIKEIFTLIYKIDRRLKRFIEHVLDKAKVQKGSKLFAHGISMARVADMLNITRWELMNYIGKTRIGDFKYQGIEVKERLKLLRVLIK